MKKAGEREGAIEGWGGGRVREREGGKEDGNPSEAG